MPVLGGAWLVSRLAGGGRASRAVLRIAAGYFAADFLTTALKTGLGRHRPDTLGGGAWRFRPLSGQAEWHALPSGHAAHAFALAAAVSDEVGSRTVAVAAYGVAALVGWQRVVSRSHWPSDVVAGALVGVVVARTTGRWLRRGPLGEEPSDVRQPSRHRDVRVAIAPGILVVTVPARSP